MRLSEIKAGVVGVGFIGVAHVEALRRLGVDVAGVVGSSPERAEAKAEAANLPKVYESVEALAADPEIDVIHIASPNHVHADQVRAVPRRRQARRLREAAGADVGGHRRSRRTGAAAADSSMRCASTSASTRSITRWRPWSRSGEIGEPRFVTGSYLQDWLLLETDWNWRLVPDEAGLCGPLPTSDRTGSTSPGSSPASGSSR